MNLDKGVATVTALETDRLVLHTSERADVLYVPLADVTRLELYQGKRRHWLLGGGIGLAVGAVTGAVLGLVIEGCYEGMETAECSAFFAVALGVPGLVVGGAIGFFVRTDRWEEVPLTKLRVGPSPVSADGLAVSVTLRL
jgi:hypothetical protein